MRTTKLSPILAVKLHTSKSPLVIVPTFAAPLVSTPPSSPGDTTIGAPVLASVRRYVPVSPYEPPQHRAFPSPTTTVYVPLNAARLVTSAPVSPHCESSSVPSGP